MSKYRNHESQAVLESKHYAKHIQAMTAENLRGKGEIGEELAARDIQIDELKLQCEELLAALNQIANDVCDNTYTKIARATIAKVKP